MRLKVKLNLLAIIVIFAVATFVSLAAVFTIDRLSGDLNERLMHSEVQQLMQRFDEAHRVLKDSGVDSIKSYVERTQVDFISEMKTFRLGESGRVYILTGAQSGLLTADDRAASDIKPDVLAEISGSKAGTREVEVAGKNSTITFDTFPDWGWKVLISMSTQEIQAKRDQFLVMVVIILLVSVVLGVFVFAWFANGFVRPILMLAEQLSSMTSENLGEGIDVPPSSSEVYLLIDSFRSLSRRLSAANAQRNKAQQDIERLNTSLERRVEERTHELEQINKELNFTVLQLQTAREDLVNSEKLASLGALVAGVAHELNTPIGNAVLCASTLTELGQDLRYKLDTGLRRSELEHLLHELVNSGSLLLLSLDRAAVLVRSFKEVAVDRASERRRLFTLSDVVDELVLSCSHEYKTLPYRISVDVARDINLDSYPGPLGQVIMNLLKNAVSHGFDGREHGSIWVRGRLADADHALLEVIDDGRGIPAESHKRIFEPFYTTKLGKGGSGLGLHLAYNIVTSVLGGQISVGNAEGGGTCFKILLPLQAPDVPLGEPSGNL